MYQVVTRDELQQLMSAPGAPILVEALPREYFAAGHLPGALHLPHDEIEERAGELLPDKRVPIVVYCASASCRNSHTAAARLERLGYDNVSVYQGGKADWEDAGLPLET